MSDSKLSASKAALAGPHNQALPNGGSDRGSTPPGSGLGGADVPGQQAPLLSSVLSLFASSGTLVCCALPALLVSLGAGAALSSLVSVFPQIVWLSEHKATVFGLAVAMTAAGGWLQWRNRFAPCPIDPALRQACLRTRTLSLRVYLGSVAVLVVGGYFAFVAPWLAARAG